MRVVDPKEVIKKVRDEDKRKSNKKLSENHEEIIPDLQHENDSLSNGDTWLEELYHLLTKEITPDAFERLTQRLLRESGFVQVEVTGRTGDGRIDVKGIARIHGFMNFHVIFR